MASREENFEASRDLSPTITGATPIEALPANTFGFDPSGVVKFEGGTLGVISWEGVGQRGGAFAQGCIEAASRELQERLDRERHGLWMRVGFANWSPEALAMILRDCEGYCAESAVPISDFKEGGAIYWGERQGGRIPSTPSAHPPLRVHLNDAGKVALTSQASEGK